MLEFRQQVKAVCVTIKRHMLFVSLLMLLSIVYLSVTCVQLAADTVFVSVPCEASVEPRTFDYHAAGISMLNCFLSKVS